MLKPIEQIDTNIKKDIIINNIMKSKGVYLLVSNPKVGKSMLALQLSYSVINGTPFLRYKVNPSPVLYVTTESDKIQLKEHLEFMELSAKKDSSFIIDKQDKAKISLNDLEYDIKTFAKEYNGKLIILDMVKDIEFEVQNVAFLVTHHLNKTGKTLRSIALNATVDERITLIENKANKNMSNYKQ